MKFKGFTLIELLIVVAIIAILAAIALPNFLEAQIRSKISRLKADMKSLATAVEPYRLDHNIYPPTGRHVPNSDEIKNFKVNSLAAWYFTKVQWTANTYGTLVEGAAGEALTTPVAYITAVPLDLFNSHMSEKKVLANAGWGKGITMGGNLYGMRYGGVIHAASQESAQTSNRPTYSDIGYCLVSAGPDLELNSNLFSPINKLGDPAIFRYTLYDPTNGTSSKGDIAHFGKGHGFPIR